MTIKEAEKIYRTYYNKSVLSPDEEFMLIEALEYLIEETKQTGWMVQLGGHYYGEKQFDLALKYYEMAESYGDTWAPEGLGYIWYYGRTGERDYEKAFKYYSKAAKNGYLKSKIKVADMYKNGYGVEKNFDMYKKIIEESYYLVADSAFPGDPKSEIYTRLARIRKDEGNTEEAIRLYLDAKVFQARRLSYNTFFGDLNIMKWLIEDLYTMTEPDMTDLSLYDLYHVLKKPIKIAFVYEGDEYVVESVEENGRVVIKFGEKWFEDIDDFFKKATIDGEKLPTLYYSLYAFRVV